jgi:hypothetical protein
MPARMFSVEGMMGLRSWRFADGTAILRAVVAANSSIAEGVASALKPRRTRVSPYPAAATARANRISETAFQGFVSMSPEPARPGLGILLNGKRLAPLKNPNGELADVERRCRVQKSKATISRAAYPCHGRPPART